MSKNIESQYLKLLKDVLDNGVSKDDRTGTGTVSVFGRQIRHDMSKGFPLLTTKKMYWRGIVTELMWFLRGDTNIKYLVGNGCNIWNGDAYKNYQGKQLKSKSAPSTLSKEEFIDKIKTDDSFANEWGELGPVYGKQWRSWDLMGKMGDYILHDGKRSIDQIQNLINELKTNPDSRRLMVSAWNPADLYQMVLPPCHYGFQVYTRELQLEERIEIAYDYGNEMDIDIELTSVSTPEESTEVLNTYGIPKRAISLMWNQRSVDTFLGLPFNIASYALLLEMLAKEVNMVPDELIGNLGDVHIYKNHIEQVKEQMNREPRKLPKLVISNNTTWNGDIDETLGSCIIDDFVIQEYDPHEKIMAPLSN